MKNTDCQTYNLNKIAEVADYLLKKYQHNNLFLLKGNLGSGKTTLAQAIGKALGYSNKINSPTFVLMKQYALPKNKFGYKLLLHADFYRAKLSDLNYLNEYLEDPKTLILIEWPEKIKKISMAHIEINFKIVNKNKRKLSIIQKS